MTSWPALRLILVLLALLVACSRKEEAPAPVAKSTPAEIRVEGDSRFSAGDWSGAVEAYRRALGAGPEEFSIRYRLAVALANLDRTAEAETEFRWVVNHGRRGQEEVRIAEQWLEALAPSSPPTASPEASDAEGESLGRVEGRTVWSGLEPGRGRLRLQILLLGDGPGTTGQRRGGTFWLGDTYRLTGLKAGRYRLMAQVAGTRLWDTTVDVVEGRPTVLDLTPATAVARPDALRLQPPDRSPSR